MSVVKLDRRENIAIVTIDNAPVNALAVAVRAGLIASLADANSDPDVVAIVLMARGHIFSAGADIKELEQTPLSPSLPDVFGKFDSSPKPIVVAIDGTALGGGFELLLACDARIGTQKASVGLPEVKLGLMPGAGGTQRLPRLIEPAVALAFIVDGNPRAAAAALELGVFDSIVSDDKLLSYAIQEAQTLAAMGRRRVLGLIELTEDHKPSFEAAALAALKNHKGEPQVEAIIECVRAAFDANFAEGVAIERAHFQRLRVDERSLSLRYAFFAERSSGHVRDLEPGVAQRTVQTAAVIGGGTMGCGIAISLLNAGIASTIIEKDQVTADRAIQRVADTYTVAVRRGSMTPEQRASRLDLLQVRVGLEEASSADLIVEAAFEDIDVKRDIFSKLSQIAKTGAVLATNTSYLDVNEIAAATDRAGDVIGLHFFSPANVMKLVEVVQGVATSSDTLRTALSVTRTIGKLPVTVRVCHGFVGNRMLGKRSEQVDRLLLEGALPSEIDAALINFGFRMGPCAMSDLAGLDISWRMRKATGKVAPAMDAIHDAGRLGQKNGRGYYLYPEGGRVGVPDPDVEALLHKVSAEQSIRRRTIPETEILDRLVLPMINEGARILEERIAQRASDIDVIWLHGYNWPRWRGGPMYFADRTGLSVVTQQLERLCTATGDSSFKPATLLTKLVAAGRNFESLSDEV
ncbi:3-hydroxyacyl-CoA dehydrogenase NAD-binding domain-containing protein [Caballeronia sp. SEWSISQ10-4 2]|uniref:3-hydroxyacyl-CoA dehydrogenase NAD-binding domain-containing protein n=1 Tax=Caballeronia sp. SEWSISQ10-4 2 TaxID=2937438 RepID=UPI002654500D|nr:3-hydroxyacyl-CoA dehydrogenase NAD-binding domain-containing protein [Caballeronia sp. SEWSISQ10-4 2]MDN7177097.1 3-hydroxyacyl-CoA dehydrogenase NAD-binding domain-containing protein [Caballeronia sp. SEWSISQ10-4 2]